MIILKHKDGFVSHDLHLLNDRQRISLFDYLGDLDDSVLIEVKDYGNSNSRIDRIVTVSKKMDTRVQEIKLSMLRILEVNTKNK